MTATRALDRVLRAGHYWVPHWYKAAHNVAYWDKFGRPADEATLRARHRSTPGGTTREKAAKLQVATEAECKRSGRWPPIS